MGLTRAALQTVPASGCGHLVEFYETEAVLAETVCAFLIPAVPDGDAAIVVASAAHRQAFETALGDAGMDVAAAAREGRYLAFDAADLLSRFMVDGVPDAERFGETIGPVMDRASRGGRGVRVYGEMVALLWADGDVARALALEALWNQLAQTRPFVLLCAYPMRAFEDDATAVAYKRICEQHTLVIPAEGLSLLAVPPGRSPAVEQLRLQTASLYPEVLRLRAQQEILAELAYIDSLTGLGNRRAFDVDLEREWALTRRDGIDSFVLAADLDGFKALNDASGHAAGDRVLRQFAMALRDAARDTDVLARIGGDEFGVLLIRCDEGAPERFMARLRELLAEQTWPAPTPIGVSLGHASLSQSPSPAEALDRADLAMLARKHRRSDRQPRRSHAPRTGVR